MVVIAVSLLYHHICVWLVFHESKMNVICSRSGLDYMKHTHIISVVRISNLFESTCRRISNLNKKLEESQLSYWHGTLESHSFNVLTFSNASSPLGPCMTASCSVRTITALPSPRSHLRYLGHYNIVSFLQSILKSWWEKYRVFVVGFFVIARESYQDCKALWV